MSVQDRIATAARAVSALDAEHLPEDVAAIARTTLSQSETATRRQMRTAVAEGLVTVQLLAGAPIDGLRQSAYATNRTKTKDLANALLQTRLMVWALKRGEK
jgi:hypothetical protein